MNYLKITLIVFDDLLITSCKQSESIFQTGSALGKYNNRLAK